MNAVYAQRLSELALVEKATGKLGNPNASLQVKERLIYYLFGEVKAFEAKIKLWPLQLRKTAV